MSKFKQCLLSTFGLIALILLIACSPNTQSINLQYLDSNGNDSRVTLHYQGDRLIKSTTTSTTLYTYLGVENVDEAKDLLPSASEILQNRAGYKITQDFKDDRYVEVLEIDYDKVDLTDDFNAFLKSTLSDDGKSVSFKKAKEELTSAGFKEVKDKKFQELPK